ncbi:hypothetical protein F2Q68_00016296 [Brassica cretica]|uniref:Uncharacterized protein n=2 Tax=Brassica cretica TaxID=69181 RepID=A0A8S9HMP2_BRACR|nr:hypothetical protein F2Q68_00016296 [Brassica cretica]KAF3606873.1 hypothetical protein DY000_02048728 [Brassica cretica]
MKGDDANLRENLRIRSAITSSFRRAIRYERGGGDRSRVEHRSRRRQGRVASGSDGLNNF